MMFDKVSKKKATDCTPAGAKIEIFVQKINDPITKKDSLVAPDGYNPNADDDAHACGDAQPAIGNINASGKKTVTIDVDVAAGKNPLTQIEIRVGSTIVATLPASAGGNFKTTYQVSGEGVQTITVTATDSAFYTTTKTKDYDFRN
jgi:penicillin-binding protein 1A